MKTIYEARNYIRSNKGKEVWVKIRGIRNKNEDIKGIISECYPNIFLVVTKDGNKSFSYSDVLIGNIEVKLN